MSVLLLYSDYTKGIANYTNALYDKVLTIADDLVKIHRLQLFDQPGVRSYLSGLLESDHNIVHIQYDSEMFMTMNCEYESLENFIWFLQEIYHRNKHAVITYHGIFDYNTINLGFLARYRLKLLRDLFNKSLVPLLNKSQVIVHSYHHQEEMTKQRITNTYVIPPGSDHHDRQSRPFSTRSHYRDGLLLPDIKIVLPGQRSGYKRYEKAIKILENLPESVSLYISDDESDVYTDAVIAKMSTTTPNRVRLATFPRDNTAYLDHLATYDCAVLPYRDFAPFSGSLQDCLNVGLPCITSLTPETSDLKDQHNCIYTADAFDETASMYVDRLIYDLPHREQMIKNINSFRDFRSWSICKDRYDDLYGLTKPRYMPSPGDVDIINVFMCCRDAADTIENTFSKLRASEAQLRESSPGWENTQFRYYILENDSVDNTPEMIQGFFETAEGNYSIGAKGSEKWGSHPGGARMRDMASYRNDMKGLCSDWSSSRYSFILDTEIEFDTDIMTRQINHLQYHPDTAMVTPYGTIDKSNIYYDQFAFRDIQDMNDHLPEITKGPISVNSAFAGFVCIRTSILEVCRWDVVNGYTSEHVPFCNMIRRHGKIIIDPAVVVRW